MKGFGLKGSLALLAMTFFLLLGPRQVGRSPGRKRLKIGGRDQLFWSGRKGGRGWYRVYHFIQWPDSHVPACHWRSTAHQGSVA